jgi:hypothetical protein
MTTQAEPVSFAKGGLDQAQKVREWQSAFAQAVQPRETAQVLKEAALWKVLCVRSALRVVFCYRPSPSQAARLIRFLQDEIIRTIDLGTRTHLEGETLVVVGGRSEAATFPYGFFKWWQLEKNTGVFEAA